MVPKEWMRGNDRVHTTKTDDHVPAISTDDHISAMEVDDHVPALASDVSKRHKFIGYSSQPAISTLGNTNFTTIIEEFGALRGFNWRSIAIYSVIFQLFFGTVFLASLMISGSMLKGINCCKWDTDDKTWNIIKVYDPVLDLSNPRDAIGSWTISATMAFDPLRILGSFAFYFLGITLLWIYYTRLTILSMLHLDDDFKWLFRAQLVWGHISAFSAYVTSVIPWTPWRYVHGGAAILYILGNYFFLFSATYMENYVEKNIQGPLSGRRWRLLGVKKWRQIRFILTVLSFLCSVIFAVTTVFDSHLNMFEWIAVSLVTFANGTFLPQFWSMRSVILIFPTKKGQGKKFLKSNMHPMGQEMGLQNIGNDLPQIDTTNVCRGYSSIPNNHKLVVEGIGNKEFKHIFAQFGRLRGCNWRFVAIFSMVIQILFALVFLPSTMVWATNMVGTCCPELDPITMRYNVTKILNPILDLNWENPRPDDKWTISQAMEFSSLRYWGECWFGLLGLSLWVMYNMRITILSMLRLDMEFPYLFRILYINGIISSIAAAIPSIFPASVTPWIHVIAYFTWVITNYIFTFSSAYIEKTYEVQKIMSNEKWKLLGTRGWQMWRLFLGILSVVCVLIFITGSFILSDPRWGIFEWLGVLLLCLSNATFLPQFWKINAVMLTF